MPHFSEALETLLYPPWREHYLDYRGLKNVIKGRSKPQRSGSSFETPLRPPSPAPLEAALLGAASTELAATRTPGHDREASFAAALEGDARRVDAFYRRTADEVERELAHMRADRETGERPSETVAATAEASARAAYVQLYRELRHLESFALINAVAVRKIVKKWNKNAAKDHAHDDAPRRLDTETFLGALDFAAGGGDAAPPALAAAIDRTEREFADRFHAGDGTLARCELLSKQTAALDVPSFHVGARVGVCGSLLLWVCFDFVVDRAGARSGILTDAGLAVYRWCGCGVLAMFCWAALLRAWVACRVNYIYMLELPGPLCWRDQLLRATTACTLYLASLLIYTKTRAGAFPSLGVPALFHPALLGVGGALYGVWILRSTPPLTKTLRAALSSWLGGQVKFRDTLAADVLTSLVKVLKDVALSACYLVPTVAYGPSRACGAAAANCALCVDRGKPFKAVVMPVVSAAPLALRLAQCASRFRASRSRWPHLFNASKYVGSLAVVAISQFHTDALPSFGRDSTTRNVTNSLYLVTFLASTLYSFWWDVAQDWGLGMATQNPCSKAYAPLRRRLAAPRCVYYVATIFDFFGRFVWTLTLVSQRSSPWMVYVTPFLAPLEILRRASWMFFRLEHQQFHNLDRYANMDWVPLHFSPKAEAEADKRRSERGVLVEAVIFAAVVAVVLGLAIS